MKKLLYQFDTDALPAVFDNVVGYDGGADHITAYGGVNAKNVGALVEGAIFTRGPKDKKYTAIFVGGGNMLEGQAVLSAVQKKFFAKFRVSVMFDCNGSNTTASAAVAWLAHGRNLAGKRAVVLGGSGPVGQRAAALLAREGATVSITGRKRDVVQSACDSIKSRFGIEVGAIEAPTNLERGAAIQGAQIVLATGAAGRHAAGGKAVAGQHVAGTGGRRQRLAARRHRRRRHERSRRGEPRKDPVRPLGLRRAQAGAAPRLHRAIVRAERFAARRRGDLRRRQDDGRLNDGHAGLRRKVFGRSRQRQSDAGRRQRGRHHRRHGRCPRVHGVQRHHRQEGLRGGRGRNADRARRVGKAAPAANRDGGRGYRGLRQHYGRVQAAQIERRRESTARRRHPGRPAPRHRGAARVRAPLAPK